MPVLRLAIPCPLRSLFDYLPPADLDASTLACLTPGVRLRVDFGRRQLQGYLIEIAAESTLPSTSLRTAQKLVDAEPLVSAGVLQLCLWAADYYQHPLGEVIEAAFTPGLRSGQAHLPPGQPGWRLSQRGKGLPDGALQRSPRQAEALSLLQNTHELATDTFRSKGISSGILRQLEQKGLAERCLLKPSAMPGTPRPGLALNTEQSAALQGILASYGEFNCSLLEGITGSGKTEVYLQLITHCLAQGQQALVLIPEIGLTPQTLARFVERFGSGIAVLHSGLNDTERYAAWEAARTGVARIIVGTRSAIFTSLRQPGLIIVDEEHDSSFKQQDGFRYSARDLAVKRGQLEGATVVLGSATPALETLHNALQGRYQHFHLTQRAGAGELPSMRAIDVRREALQGGLSAALREAIEATLQAGQQVLLFLNRRGYAPALQCHDCGWIAECRACDTRMTVHRRQRRLRCHHCAANLRLPEACPQCHSARLLTNGLGTEQTEDTLQHIFGNWPIHRVDSDSMQGKGAMQALVTQVSDGQPCILLGTQMLTKGHHFPGVSLVAVIDADALLFSADFRGEERMAQLLTQVAGRAGRANDAGQVLVQTHYPDHPLMLAMLTESYAEQARRLLETRRDSGMPPHSRLLLLRTDSPASDTGEKFLGSLRQQAQPKLPEGCRLIGPLPSPLQRRAGKFRNQLLAMAPDVRRAQQLARLLVHYATQLPARSGLNWSIDVDPLDLG